MPTIELTFRPGASTQVQIDDRNLLFRAVHRKTREIPDQTQVIWDGLENPIGTAKLDDLLKPGHNVVIMVDDITRPTPAARILPLILEKIHAVGIPDRAVRFFVGLGTHRPMTEEELRIKLGDGVLAHFEVINRDYRDGDYVDLGQTESGTPVEINREVLEADFKIAVGNVIPHISAGWGGGSKMILPGVCSAMTTDVQPAENGTHLRRNAEIGEKSR